MSFASAMNCLMLRGNWWAVATCWSMLARSMEAMALPESRISRAGLLGSLDMLFRLRVGFHGGVDGSAGRFGDVHPLAIRIVSSLDHELDDGRRVVGSFPVRPDL